MIRRLLWVVSLSCATSAVAAPPTRESIDALLEETKMFRTIDSVMDNMTRLVQQQNAALFADRGMTPEQQRAMTETQAKVAVVIRQEMTFAKLEPIYVDVYQQTFTQDEVDGLIAFYRTPAGRSYIDKMPDVLQRTNVAMQPLMKEMMEKVQVIAKQAMDELRASDAAKAPPKP